MLHVLKSTIIDEPIITANIKITDTNYIVLDAWVESPTTAVTLHLS
jgi:hypothetical protein